MKSEFDYKTFHDIIVTYDAHTSVNEEAELLFGASHSVPLPPLEHWSRLRLHHLDLLSLSIYHPLSVEIGQTDRPIRNFFDKKWKELTLWLHANKEQVEVAYNSPDFERLAFSKKKGVVLRYDNKFGLATESVLDELYRQGIRVFSLSSAVPSISHSTEIANDKGLTRLGEQLVAKLNRLGIVIDLAHAPAKLIQAVVSVSNHPVVVSHFSEHIDAKNSDPILINALKAIADKGGIVHISPGNLKLATGNRHRIMSGLLQQYGLIYGEDWDLSGLTKQQLSALKTSYEQLTDAVSVVDIPAFIARIDDAVQLLGIDHVGIGSGWNITASNDVFDASLVTKALMDKSYSEADIRKLWGRNYFFLLDLMEKNSINNPWGISN